MSRPPVLPGKLLATVAACAAFVLLVRMVPFGVVGAEPASPAPTGEPAASRRPLPPCLTPGAPCSSDPETVLAGVGLDGFTLTPAAVAPRTGPVPLASGSTEIARYELPGLTLFLDRPSAPDLALELAALAFHEAGWRRAAADPELRAAAALGAGAAASGEVFVRGAETAIVTLDADTPGEPLFLIAYRGEVPPPETAP